MSLTYQEVFEACQLFNDLPNTFNREWLHAKKFYDWQNLCDLPEKEIRDRNLKFLNQWSSHIKKTPEVIQGIKQAHKDTREHLHALMPITLWDLNFDDTIQINGETNSVKDSIYYIFMRFTDVGYHLREVASSKILHHIHPNLFIMWDNKIMSAYGVKRNPSQYVNVFMPLMKVKLNQVIDSYMKDFKVDRDEAIKKMNTHVPHKTMVKLLDEYNWINYTYFSRTP